MIDIHTHILFDVDDGSDTIEESVALIKSAQDAGITKIILTPHYTGNSRNDYRNEKVDQNFDALVEELKKNNINVQLYLGNEVAIYGDVLETLEDSTVKCLANSRFMLIEFPMQANVGYCLNTVYEMRIKNVLPIIAHPERCECFKKNLSLVKKVVEEGALIQVNIGSVFGDYGSKAKHVSRKLLKMNLVHFLATDTHHVTNRKYEKIQKRLKKLNWIIGKEKVQEITVQNQEKILKNEAIVL